MWCSASQIISAFGSNKIEFNIENSMFDMDYIMEKNNGIKVYDEDGRLLWRWR